jgi:hypothetical protein
MLRLNKINKEASKIALPKDCYFCQGHINQGIAKNKQSSLKLIIESNVSLLLNQWDTRLKYGLTENRQTSDVATRQISKG